MDTQTILTVLSLPSSRALHFTSYVDIILCALLTRTFLNGRPRGTMLKCTTFLKLSFVLLERTQWGAFLVCQTLLSSYVLLPFSLSFISSLH